ncbi:lytic transglycosylase domain-containing protein [Qipengyuania sediminis]|uniref:lytic transglycosylase domain-containing protein n=1 Tax=Qipengyuania sediminis TaxID=1532023 RepID=UPI00105A0999|nr:lytic transglycosylase domain-containing protein [Qipengyuania sediminis]
MSSMVKMTVSTLLAGAALALTASAAAAQDATSWDRARSNLVAEGPGPMAPVIARWEYLTAREGLGFGDYAGFITSYPDFPKTELLRRRAEAALERESPGAAQVAAFFDKTPPLTNPARAQYALALTQLGRAEAATVARAAWRGGSMSAASEAALAGIYAARFIPDDQAARMDALMWQNDGAGGARQVARLTGPARDLGLARQALVQGQAPEGAGLAVPANALSDPGYAYNLARYHRTRGNLPAAISLLANRPRATAPVQPRERETMIGELLRVARGAGADSAARIAASADDIFLPGATAGETSFKLRDDYTSLMWLGGTKALWELGDGRRAAPLFYRYGAAAKTPQTRSKGFFWAGRAASRGGDRAEASRYYAMAAEYPERFYGQLAIRELGRAQPSFATGSVAVPTPAQQALFDRSTLVRAVREVARDAPWRTGVQFYRELAEQAETPESHAMVSALARQIGRRDLAVILADAAGTNGLGAYVAQGYPTVPAPAGTNWTFVHAIARQESQFAENAISHAGARGLMQLMPGTAREQAGKMGISYMSADLIGSVDTNIRLGDGYFARMMSYYGGSYPLAVAAYNAGPGNVNKWLRANGDPRQGGVSWIDWIERIPLSETRNYVHRVIENAAAYEQLYPARAPGGRPRVVSDFLR